MKKNCLVILALVLHLKSYSQNLILNPSFENHHQCPDNFGQVDSCEYVFNPLLDAGSTPDYFHACSPVSSFQVPNNQFGYKQAYSGGAYLGFYLGLEYIQIKLSKTLEKNKNYKFSFHLSLPRNSESASSDIQLKFKNDSAIYNQPAPIILVPDWTNKQGVIEDTVNWVKLYATYKAKGDENWIIIGCFKPLDQINIKLFSPSGGLPYYFIDDITLDETELLIPNIFTPNGDGINDLFYVNFLTERDSIYIYNRWGKKVQKMSGNESWNGDNLEDGVYFIVIYSEDAKIKTGSVQLLR